MPLFNTIAVEGLPGSGKSFLAKKIAEKFMSQNNLIISQKHKDFNQINNFQSEIQMLLQRFQEHKDREQFNLFGTITIWDYFIHKSQIYALLTLNDNEFEIFKKLVKALHIDKIQYDLIIYIQNSTDKIMQQIELNSKIYTESFTAEFYNRLNNLMNDFFFHYQQAHLIFNTNAIDIFNDSDHLELILNEIINFKGQSKTIVIR